MDGCIYSCAPLIQTNSLFLPTSLFEFSKLCATNISELKSMSTVPEAGIHISLGFQLPFRSPTKGFPVTNRKVLRAPALSSICNYQTHTRAAVCLVMDTQLWTRWRKLDSCAGIAFQAPVIAQLFRSRGDCRSNLQRKITRAILLSFTIYIKIFFCDLYYVVSFW